MGAMLRELGIDRLSVIERMRLVEEIRESIATESPASLAEGKSSELFQRAVAEASKLPTPAQDEIAAQIFAQISDDRAWDASFAQSQDQLGRWAQSVRQNIATGRVRALSRRRS
jgi:putative addiction module component (TIGR02574 family)